MFFPESTFPILGYFINISIYTSSRERTKFILTKHFGAKMLVKSLDS